MNGNEKLIHIASDNSVFGQVDKVKAHQDAGVLHRAFTAFLFDENGNVLITQRSNLKPLWPGFWDAACSSHPWFPDETVLDAATRRIPFELGISPEVNLELEELFAYEYHAIYSPEWSENEINSIVVGKYQGEVNLNRDEVAAYEWASSEEVTRRLEETNDFSPWFQYAWDGLLERNRIPVPRTSYIPGSLKA